VNQQRQCFIARQLNPLLAGSHRLS